MMPRTPNELSFLSLNDDATLINYDHNGERRCRVAVGNLTTLSYGDKSLMSYDALGWLITEVQQNTGGTPILTMVDTYDAAGRKTRRVKQDYASSKTLRSRCTEAACLSRPSRRSRGHWVAASLRAFSGFG